MVERYNGRITDQLARSRFGSSQALADGINGYREVYVNHIPQRAFGHVTPRAALLDWFQKRPDLFRNDPQSAGS